MTDVLQTVVRTSFMNLLVTLETVIGGKGGTTGVAFEFFESTVEFDVVLQ